MVTFLEAQRLAACTEHLAACNLRQHRITRSFATTGRPAQQIEQSGRRVATRTSTAAASALAEATVEAPASSQTDEQAAQQDDAFPGVAPEDLTALPEKAKYAVVEIGGLQMFVQEGRWYNCNRLQAEPGQTIQLGRVLAVKDDGKFSIGKPYLENAVVKAEIVEDLKGPKLTIFKMHRKKHYRRKTGHRQPLTQFYVTEISQ